MENNATQAQYGQQPQQGQTDPQQGAGEVQPKDYKALYEEAVKESRKWIGYTKLDSFVRAGRVRRSPWRTRSTPGISPTSSSGR